MFMVRIHLSVTIFAYSYTLVISDTKTKKDSKVRVEDEVLVTAIIRDGIFTTQSYPGSLVGMV